MRIYSDVHMYLHLSPGKFDESVNIFREWLLLQKHILPVTQNISL